jgi:hypothetical protein
VQTQRLIRVSAVTAVIGALAAGGAGAAFAHGGPGDGGGPRAGETPLTGDTLTKVTSAALAKVPGATVVRAETDADGNAKYEAHLKTSDGKRVTVYVNESFTVVKVASDPDKPAGTVRPTQGGPRHG